jgi:hypothetical protein
MDETIDERQEQVHITVTEEHTRQEILRLESRYPEMAGKIWPVVRSVQEIVSGALTLAGRQVRTLKPHERLCFYLLMQSAFFQHAVTFVQMANDTRRETNETDENVN